MAVCELLKSGKQPIHEEVLLNFVHEVQQVLSEVLFLLYRALVDEKLNFCISFRLLLLLVWSYFDSRS